MSTLAIVVNDQLTLQFDRTKPLPEHHQHYLNRLDAKFDQGIELQGKQLANPGLEQRAKYMALSLMEGIMYQEDDKAAASMAWLATRLPELKQLVAVVDEQGARFELIFDREYQPHVAVNFKGLTN